MTVLTLQLAAVTAIDSLVEDGTQEAAEALLEIGSLVATSLDNFDLPAEEDDESPNDGDEDEDEDEDADAELNTDDDEEDVEISTTEDVGHLTNAQLLKLSFSIAAELAERANAADVGPGDDSDYTDDEDDSDEDAANNASETL